jgi:hypothetical protein
MPGLLINRMARATATIKRVSFHYIAARLFPLPKTQAICKTGLWKAGRIAPIFLEVRKIG